MSGKVAMPKITFAPKRIKIPPQTTRIVEVNFTSTGGFTYTYHDKKRKMKRDIEGHIHANPEDTIELKFDWQNHPSPYAIIILFMPETPFTPFTKKHYQTIGNTPITGKIPRDIPHGKYPFAVIAYDGKQILIDDPETIIPEPPGI